VEAVAATSSAQVYRPRRPERTVLYRALSHHFEHFLHVYEDRFRHTHGYLRGCVEPAVHRYLDCGIFDQGVARVRCPDCRHEFLIAFSCKLRGLCPSCHQKRELLWTDWAEQELLEEVPHRQVVFTIPKRLRIFFRYDRRLLGELAGCAWRALKLYFAAYFDGADVSAGAAGFLQTSGELLNFHPHVHVLVTDGGFLPDGTFRPLVWFHSQHVERLFRAEVLRMLLAKELISEAVVDNLLSWHHSGFSAHGAVRVEDRKGAVRLGRYMIRCPIVLKRLTWEKETGEVVCRGRPSRRGGPDGGEARWDVLEFLARVVDHIPEPSQQTVPLPNGWPSTAGPLGRASTPVQLTAPGSLAATRSARAVQHHFSGPRPTLPGKAISYTASAIVENLMPPSVPVRGEIDSPPAAPRRAQAASHYSGGLPNPGTGSWFSAP